MRTSIRAAALPILLAAPCQGHAAEAPPSSRPADELVVACSPDALVAGPGDAVRLRAFVAAAEPSPVSYRWTSAAGEIRGSGSDVEWVLPAAEPGYYTASVEAADDRGRTASCAVTLWLREGIKGPDDRRLNRRSLLRCAPEPRAERGYGVYSYLLLPFAPTADTRPRHAAAIEAYLRLIQEVAEYQAESSRRNLNITYLPVKSEPGEESSPDGAATVEWVSEHYDHECADRLAAEVPGADGDGPYIVSAYGPLGGEGALAKGYLFMDLSRVEPSLVELWVREYLRQSASREAFEQPSGPRLALRIRSTIAVLGKGAEETMAALVSWKAAL